MTTQELRQFVGDSVRLYFAPLTGSIKGIREEFKTINLEIRQRREADEQRRQAKAP